MEAVNRRKDDIIVEEKGQTMVDTNLHRKLISGQRDP